jgi:copper chaperone
MSRINLEITGMTCSHCLTAVRKAVEGVDGAELEELTLGAAKVRFDPSKTDVERIKAAVADAGYAASVAAA